MKFSLLTLTAIVPLATAHFKLMYPTSRGFDEDTMPNFPCGGMSQSSNRTKLPLSGGSFPVALEMHHSQTAVEVLLALGSDPGDNFNIVLSPTFQVNGLGEFCLPHVEINEKLIGRNLTNGMNATLQVQTNGDPSGGLYAVCSLPNLAVYCGILIQYSAPISSSLPMSRIRHHLPVAITPISLPPPSPRLLLHVMPTNRPPRVRHRADPHPRPLQPRLPLLRLRLPPPRVLLYQCKPPLGDSLVLLSSVVLLCCKS